MQEPLGQLQENCLPLLAKGQRWHCSVQILSRVFPKLLHRGKAQIRVLKKALTKVSGAKGQKRSLSTHNLELVKRVKAAITFCPLCATIKKCYVAQRPSTQMSRSLVPPQIMAEIKALSRQYQSVLVFRGRC